MPYKPALKVESLELRVLFREIIGQEEIKAQLRASVREGRIPHAQLFTGISGIGKLQLALAYAQYLNCPHRTDEDSCGQCPTCLQMQKLQHPDLHFVFPIVKTDDANTCDAFMEDWRKIILSRGYFDLEDWYKALGVESKQGMIYEKESGEILRKLSLKPFGDGYKVMIIWQPEKMNISTSNKLLKLLEEPPAQTVFLMVSEHPDELLSTILSRVQRIQIPRLPNETVAAALVQKGVPSATAADIARIANGSYLQALKKANQSEENKADLRAFIALFRNAYTVGMINDAEKKFEALKQLRQWSLDMADAKTMGRERQKHFLQYAQQQVRENYIRNWAQADLNYQLPEEREFSVKFAPFIHLGNVEGIMRQLDLAERQIEQNGNAKIIFFDICLQMIVLIKKKVER